MSEKKDLQLDGGWLVGFFFLFVPGLWWIGALILWDKTKHLRRRTSIRKPLLRLGWPMFGWSLVMFFIGWGKIGIFMLLGALTILGSSLALGQQDRRRHQYIAFIGDRDVISVDEIADAMGVSKHRAYATIEKLLQEDYLGPDSYLDRRSDTLVLSPNGRAEAEQKAAEQKARRSAAARKAAETRRANAEAARKAAEAAEAAEADKAVETEKAPEPTNSAESVTPEEMEYARECQALLDEIRALNGRIKDPAVSRKIDRIAEITANIFYRVQQNPDKRKEIRQFMGYYLPSTLKLLHAYENLEKQPVQNGQNIVRSKQSIESILDKLVEGFSRQLDQLFQTDAIDISSDIKVLEQMMELDGYAAATTPFTPYSK